MKLPESFWSKVVKQPSGCWNWIGCHATQKHPYGLFTMDGKQHRTHRLSYEAHKGSIPAGLHICHACDNPACVNPDHLWAGTHQDNMKDSGRKGGHSRFESHNGAVKLNRQQIETIKKRAATGEKRTTIAADYGINDRTVRKIVSGERWGWIGG